ncbi:MAG TPA: hypothetical protein VGU02_09565, partial [Gaiellaceae bacterium]|nr:hypothetical protein [Gaiellaceae bacterium]
MLSGRLVDNQGLPIGNEPLTLSLNNSGSETCTATTGNAGVASCAVTVLEGQGSYPVTASFAGGGDYQPSSGSDTAFVTGPAITAVPTSLPYQGQFTAVAGSTESLTFKLTDSQGNALANQLVVISVDGQAYQPPVTTDSNGLATLQVNLAAGTHTVTSAFSGALVGTKQYQPSNGTGSIVVSKIPTTTTVSASPAVTYGAAAVLSATLVDSSGNPVAGRIVTLSFGANGIDSCTGTTNAAGQISCTTGPVQSPASATPYTVTATFAGDTNYLGSTGTGSIVVNRAQTTIVDKVTGSFLLGAPLTVSGTLTSNGSPVAGKTLLLTFGLSSCTTTTPTNATGTASCTITGGVPGPSGDTLTTATFLGDANYRAAIDHQPALVYAFAPGGGSFVVGDQTSTGSVYFWGSQWWKQNSLSNDDPKVGDPAAFKGFADSPSTPQCGVDWVANPGNSSKPPSGPLPTYMAVIVTDRDQKVPGAITGGDTVAIVIVKTDGGYKNDPGHPGTGTVVGTLCTGSSSGGSGGSGDDGGSGSGGSGSTVDCTAKGTKCESLLANPSAAQGATVSAGQTLKVLYTDDAQIGTAQVTIDGQSLTSTVASTSGVTPTYVDSYGGSKSTKYEDWISFAVPTGLAAGAHTIVVTVHDGDGDYDVYSWTIKI